MNRQFSFEAHLLHSGLQMIWKRLDVTTNMDAKEIFARNKDQFYLVASGVFRRFGVACQEQHFKEASEMLHYAFQLNIPKSFYVIVQGDGIANIYPVTLDKYGKIVKDSDETEMTYKEAYEILLKLNERYPRERFWIEQRIPRYVRRIMLGD